MLQMTEEEYQALLRKRQKAAGAAKQSNTSHSSKHTKYFNTKIYVYEDGFTSEEKSDSHGKLKEKFDSVKEFQRCGALRILQSAGRISALRMQVPLMIQESFISKDGTKHRAIKYVADFMYIENGQTVIEDVKGYDEKKRKYRTTEAFRLKWKLLQARYPDFLFRIF